MAESRRAGMDLGKMGLLAAGAAVLVAAGISIGWIVARNAPAGGGDGQQAATGAPGHSAAGRMARDDAGRRSERREGNRAESTEVPTSFAPGMAREWLRDQMPGITDFEFDLLPLMLAFQKCAALDQRSSHELLSTLLDISRLVETDEDGEADGKSADLLADVPEALRKKDLLGMMMVFASFRLAQHDDTAILDLLSGPGADENSSLDEVRQMAYAMGTWKDPVAAAAMVDSAGAENRRSAMEGLIKNWSVKDPEMVYKLLAKYPDGELETARVNFILRAGAGDPLAGLEMARRLTVDTGDEKLLPSVLRQISGSDTEAEVARWAEAYHGPGEAGVKAMIIERNTRDDPAKAADALGKLLVSGTREDLSGFAASVARELAMKNPVEARNWTETLPAGPSRAAAEEQLAASWTYEHPKAAAEWINTLPQGSTRDSAVTKLVQAMNRNLPKEAFDWAVSVQDGDSRDRVVSETLAIWSKQDPEAALEARREYQKKNGRGE